MEISTESNKNSEVFDSKHLRQNSGDELTFSDWQFVDKCPKEGSDDESIEVIEREVLASLPSLSNTDNEESDNEDDNYKDICDESDVTNDIQAILPSNQCHSCAPYIKKINKESEVSNGVTWKVLYSFTLGVLASIIIHHYKGYIPGKLFNFHVENEINTADSVSFPFIPENSYLEGFSDLDFPNLSESDDNIMNRLKGYIEKQKIIMNNEFLDKLDLLEFVKQPQKDIYVFGISNNSMQGTAEEKILSFFMINKKIPPCPNNVSRKQVPYICNNRETFLVFVKKSDMIMLYDMIRQFFSCTKRRLNSLYTKMNSVVRFNKRSCNKKRTNNFVPDCDHFGKEYKSSSYCFEKNSNDDETVEKGNNRLEKRCKKARCNKKSSFQNEHERLPDDSKMYSKNSESEGSDHVEEKFKQSRYNEKFSPQDEHKQLPDVNKNEESNSANDETVPKEDDKKSISGDWLFNLYEARAKLRAYYEKVVTGDWILKLGKQRENLRKNSNDHKSNFEHDDKDEKNERQWYKKASENFKRKSEDFKRKFKTYVTEWKHKFQVVKENIADKFDDLKMRFKNKFRK